MNKLKNIALFKNCDPSFLKKLKSSAQTQKHSKGKILFLHGDAADRFFLIKSGWIKLFRETLDGTQAIIDIVSTGHIVGETSILENNTYPYSAEIIGTTELISMSLSALKTEVENDNTLALNMLNSMMSYRQQQDREIEHKALQNASQRIGCFILRLALQNGQETKEIAFPYDKTLVAARLGMQPETFSRALAKLRKQTRINIKGSTVMIENMELLSHYACAACSAEFPCKDLVGNK